MEICVIGTGYVGLVTGACFAEMGHRVVCVDIDKKKIEKLRDGEIPIYEPGLAEVVERNVAAGRLRFAVESEAAPVCFLCLPTPSKADGSADLSYMKKAAEGLALKLQEYTVIVNKSTVPVGTTDLIHEVIAQKTDVEFDVVSNPEFLKEGAAVTDCMKPDRIVLGVPNEKAEKIMREIYAAFTLNRDRIVVTDPRSAEMIKYAANAMLATRISFMNEIAALCEKVDADIHSVRKGIGSDKRIGYDFLYAGTGFGGSCFPKDLRALSSIGEDHGINMSILRAAYERNCEQKRVIGKKLDTHFAPDGGLQGKTIAIWGVAFKPETDDIREAPALELIHFLLGHGAKIRLYDPIALENVEKVLDHSHQIAYCASEIDAAEGADAIALMTEWKQFRFLDFEKILEKMVGNAFFDGRNVYSRETMEKKGFHYYGIGTKRDQKAAARAPASV